MYDNIQKQLSTSKY